MALVSLRQVLDHAAEHSYGVPAFNVNNLEQVQAIMEAAAATDSPVILQASAGARKYAGEAYLRHLIIAAAEVHPELPIVLHQDHGTSPAVCQQSIRSGFSSVMMDGSLMSDGKTPASYEYNIEVTELVCRMAHAIGVSVEGELGCLGSLETGEAGEEDGVGAEGKLSHDQLLTDPTQAKDFVEKTGCRCAGDCHRHQPWRLQVHPQAHRRHSGHRPHRPDPRRHSQHPSGDARLQQRAAGVAGNHPSVRRRDEGNLRRAG
jgi:fructose-bisphosphate aldolase class II